MDGWLKLHRSLADHWIFSFKEPDKALAWIDLLIMARHTGGTVMLKGRALNLERGQIGISQLSLQKKWGWSQNKVKRFLNLLKKHDMCDFKTNDLTTVITICNFDSFQAGERADERSNGRADERPVERATDDQSNDDIRKKESKEGNNEKKKPTSPTVDFSVFNVSDDQISEIKRIRRKNKGGSWSPKIVNTMAGEFQKAFSTGLTLDDVLTEWEYRGWKSFKAEWMKPNNRLGANQIDQQRETEVNEWVKGDQQTFDNYTGGETIDHEPF